jgi:hypothetical protein
MEEEGTLKDLLKPDNHKRIIPEFSSMVTSMERST